MHNSVMKPSSPLTLQPPPASHATHLSLRGGEHRTPLHPLKQSPSSTVDDGHFDDVDFTDAIRPPPSAFSPATTAATAYDPHSDSPSPLENFRPAPHIGHQRSLTDTFFDNSQQFLSRATSTLQQHTSRASLHSPTKSLASFIPSRSAVESTASQPKIRALQNWFNGTSGAVNLGVPPQADDDDEDSDSGSDSVSVSDGDSYDYDSEEEEEEEEEEDGNMMAGIFSRAPALTRTSTHTPKPSSPAPSKPQTQTPTTSSKFAWLLSTQKNAAPPPSSPSPPTYHNPSDELLKLNISTSLFPHGPVDPLDPTSFHDLLSNAESLLSRYQSSYRKLSSSLVDAEAEQSAQDDELDEAETRVRHLKMQLEAMAARASEQDAQMQQMMEELTFERRARQEEEAARKRSLALIRGGSGCEHNVRADAGLEQDSPRRRNRISNSDVSVDSGFESECETDAASIFSHTNCMSPTSTVASEFEPADATPKGKRIPKPQPLERTSTYDKVRDGSVDLAKGGWGCVNCEGGSQASVWGRLAKEREENHFLRKRVGELEEGAEDALNIIRTW
ncbi:hypothetical protein BDV95DRAFT_504801 [Massariosphaeria phaeospora]|uniref:Uncharacterized protein n=1 Tax=Massariosphaeria phaeospora TaxID=100035 RepID=A0A7C8M3L5_9PLEO|nr:hypothetical protein BDV95DRAFT_504801 [Massariosphaeria phaeospora]